MDGISGRSRRRSWRTQRLWGQPGRFRRRRRGALPSRSGRYRRESWAWASSRRKRAVAGTGARSRPAPAPPVG